MTYDDFIEVLNLANEIGRIDYLKIYNTENYTGFTFDGMINKYCIEKAIKVLGKKNK